MPYRIKKEPSKSVWFYRFCWMVLIPETYLKSGASFQSHWCLRTSSSVANPETAAMKNGSPTGRAHGDSEYSHKVLNCFEIGLSQLATVSSRLTFCTIWKRCSTRADQSFNLLGISQQRNLQWSEAELMQQDVKAKEESQEKQFPKNERQNLINT